MDYEQAVENFYKSVLKEGDIAVDCGAHTGRHTRPMSDLVGDAGHVYAFEPLPAPFKTLEESVAERSNLTLHNCALGSSAGTVPFVYVPQFPEYSGFRERIYHDDALERQSIMVSVVRLDDAVPSRPIRYIKIDAEGGDLTILRGAERHLRFSRPYVTFECGDNSIKNYDYTSADYFDFFDRIGYGISTILGDKLDRAAFIESSAVQQVWDYIASPKS
ncbi:FkbM family methyltransferase [Mesorhizobium sp.]|uniref:FkbM family methyltransferase n=1 Tax=Mesorhizobium sp. TaxID=1871066 RepID=UPI0011F7C7D8|nr:FkbM family methyltransferase [Mesorhizobium sp.]TIN82192.1 MAG: FkbM family methyltransferase [Mesorhizobium sp.]